MISLKKIFLAKEDTFIGDPEQKFFEITDELAKQLADDLDFHADFEEWKMGLEVEQEHMVQPFDVVNGNKLVVAKIAAIHLVEDPKYYSKLKSLGL